jgi:hypothetical protein
MVKKAVWGSRASPIAHFTRASLIWFHLDCRTGIVYLCRTELQCHFCCQSKSCSHKLFHQICSMEDHSHLQRIPFAIAEQPIATGCATAAFHYWICTTTICVNCCNKDVLLQNISNEPVSVLTERCTLVAAIKE